MTLAACTLDFQRVGGRVACQERGQLVALLDHGGRRLYLFFEPFLRRFLDENWNEVANPPPVEFVKLFVDHLRDVVALEAREPLRQTVDHLVDGLCFVQLAHGFILQRRRSRGNSVHRTPRCLAHSSLT